MPLHFLIADASGRAFVWEPGRGGVEHIIEVDDRTMTSHFYLGDDTNGAPRYSPETAFRPK